VLGGHGTEKKLVQRCTSRGSPVQETKTRDKLQNRRCDILLRRLLVRKRANGEGKPKGSGRNDPVDAIPVKAPENKCVQQGRKEKRPVYQPRFRKGKSPGVHQREAREEPKRLYFSHLRRSLSEQDRPERRISCKGKTREGKKALPDPRNGAGDDVPLLYRARL